VEVIDEIRATVAVARRAADGEVAFARRIQAANLLGIARAFDACGVGRGEHDLVGGAPDRGILRGTGGNMSAIARAMHRAALQIRLSTTLVARQRLVVWNALRCIRCTPMQLDATRIVVSKPIDPFMKVHIE
jgi:hypothetical protein